VEKMIFQPKRVLVPTDFSKDSDQALGKAVDLARTYGSKIYLLHVIDDEIQQCAIDYCLDNETVSEVFKGSIKHSKKRLSQIIEKAGGSNGIEISQDIKTGNPIEEIIKFQKKNGIDLIVMAPHGRRGIMKSLLGGVAEKVVRMAGCPVLLMKD
jgi:nucleotide-binding universal stress UspA family protein